MNILAFMIFSQTADDIRDIQPPVEISLPWMWAVWLLVAAAGIIVAWLLWRRLKSRKKIPPKLPHEIALEQLGQAARLIPTGNAREFSFEVSEIVRIYIEHRFHTRAAPRTTEEFLYQLLEQKNSPLAAYNDLLKNFLNHCDLAKFGRESLSQSEMQNMLESAQSFVINTVPQPETKS